jgi:hypothetical protein
MIKKNIAIAVEVIGGVIFAYGAFLMLKPAGIMLAGALIILAVEMGTK